MSVIPKRVAAYLAALMVEQSSGAYLTVDSDGSLSNWGGDLHRYGVRRLERGVSVRQQVYFLEGLLPADEVPVIVPFVRTRKNAFFDIHILKVDSRDWILLLDTSREAERLRRKYLKISK
jgi:hypothetical protein